ncbi:MAG: OsmC family protein [Terriglobia bacterium]|jgi:uncharacterized OsmC-like protein
MKLTVDLTKENGFRIKSGSHVFVCDQAAEVQGRHAALTPAELLIASLGASISDSAVKFCREHSQSASGLKIALEWEYARDQQRIGRIDVSVHLPNAVSESLEDDFMCAIHLCEVYQTLEVKPVIHYHSTLDLEKPEGETLIHFAGAE